MRRLTQGGGWWKPFSLQREFRAQSNTRLGSGESFGDLGKTVKELIEMASLVSSVIMYPVGIETQGRSCLIIRPTPDAHLNSGQKNTFKTIFRNSIMALRHAILVNVLSLAAEMGAEQMLWARP